jgi:hypothetical protein
LHAELVPVVVPIGTAAVFIGDRKPPSPFEIQFVATEATLDSILIDDDVDLIPVLREVPVLRARIERGVGRHIEAARR